MDSSGGGAKVQLAPCSTSRGDGGKRRFFPFNRRLRRRLFRGAAQPQNRRQSRSSLAAPPQTSSASQLVIGAGEMSDCLLAVKIDELSRMLFPVCFAAFNVLYWTYYTQWSR